MKKINIFNCGGKGCANTGNYGCQFVPGATTMLYLVPRGKKFSAVEAQTLDTVLSDLAKADNPRERVYPVGPFVDFEDKSSEAVTGDTGYGKTNFVRDGNIRFSFRMDLGICSWAKMRNYNNQASSWDVLLVDKQNNVVWGTQTADGGLKGFSLSLLLLMQFKANTGAEVWNYSLDIQFEEIAEFENFAVVQFESPIKVMQMVQGLFDIGLMVTLPLDAGGKVNICATAGCGSSNLAEIYGKELGDPSAWLATNTTTGLPIAITGIVNNPTDFTVALDTADANYPTAAGGNVTLSLVPVSELETLGIIGYEGCSVTVVTV